MDNLDYKIKNILSEEIVTGHKYQNMIRTTLTEKNNKNKNFFVRKGFKLITATCMLCIITTSIVFAKDISSWVKGIFNNKSEGLDTAIENGYILNSNMNFINSNGTEAKLNNLIMDDFNLNFTVNFKFTDEITVSEISAISLPDMIIVDNENKIIYCQDKKIFNEFCKSNNLSLKYKNFNEYNINSGSNWFIKEKNSQDNSLALVYNLYANDFPKSKELNLYFQKIEIERNENDKNNTFITGDWKLNIQIPSEFYNRNAIVYKVKNCSNPKINITEAVVYNTCMKLCLNIQEDIIYEIGDSQEVIDEKIRKKLDEENEENFKKASQGDFESIILFNNDPYVETTNGNKFYPANNSSEDSGYSHDYITGLISYWQTFNLTSYDTTDNLKIFFKYKGEDIWIDLEK